MILNKGSGNGNQVLRPETVAAMGQNHIGALNVTKMVSALPVYTNDVDLFPDQEKKWGLSFLINTRKTPEGRSPNSLFWAGLANTYLLDRSVARRLRRDPDAAVAVRRPPQPGSLRGPRARRLCRARRRAAGGLKQCSPDAAQRVALAA